MKILLLFITCISIFSKVSAQSKLSDTTDLLPIEVKAIRASDKTPVTKTNLSKAQIKERNNGQDLPFLLNQTPAVVANSDAGNAIGYTGIRIRGTDASRINVTLNGIPYNDAESQGTFLVNIPDIASSANSIQIQRGIGTSTNGAGAFGGSINISTNDITRQSNIEINNSFGSFGTFKNTILFNSGIFNNHFTVDGRISNIQSDGYIDRASTKLQSVFFSGAYLNEKSSLRLNIFTGKEKTYQAWNGVIDTMMKINRRYNSSGTAKPGTPYDNETDNYTQTHYQLFYNTTINKFWKANIAAFLTRGKGYYEQYKAGAKLKSYGLPNYINGLDTITKTDIVRQLWLDNYYYGTVFSAQYENKSRQIIIGGGYNQYDGKHYGKIIKAIVQPAVPKNYQWYDNDAKKSDFSVYTKYTEKITPRWQTYVDLQVRKVNYTINGFRDNPNLNVKNDYFFFNPKAGITYSHKNIQSYISYAIASKEPNRDDFEAGKQQQPKAEKLHDLEAGVEAKYSNASWGVNLYYMSYKNQLVLTGQINDVGAFTRTNIPKSFRTGIELQGAYVFNKYVEFAGNLSLSSNKVKNFTEYISDYDTDTQVQKNYKKSTIAYSPSVVAAANLKIKPIKNGSIEFINKFVSEQYLDNTENDNRKLDDYYTADVKLGYSIKTKQINTIDLYFQINNVFGKLYAPNGYTYSYISEQQLYTENYYFPMAPLHFVFGINIKL